MIYLCVILETQQKSDHNGNEKRTTDSDHEFMTLSFALQITPGE
jgi:hypothetical protein